MKRIRFLLSLGIVATLILALIPVSAVLAAKPTIVGPYTFSISQDVEGICTFPIHIDAVITGRDINFTDQNGALVRISSHTDQQDTFSANGKTLVGLPYTYEMDFRFDSSGNIISIRATGIIEKVPLPDGSLYISAGWLDFTSRFPTMVIQADRGNPGNLAGLCAALAP